VKIRRITLAVLLILTLLFAADVKYFSGLRSIGGRQPAIEIEKSKEEGVTAGRTREFTHSKQEITKLKVQNQGGEIIVEQAAGDEISVAVEIKAVGADLEEAVRKMARWSVDESRRGDLVSYRVRGEAPAKGEREVEAAFLIKVPAGLEITLEQGFGEVTVTGVAADLKLDVRHSTAEIAGLEGMLTIASGFSAVNLKDISSRVVIDDSHSAYDISGLLGGLELTSSFSTFALRDIADSLAVKDSHSTVEVFGFAGGIDAVTSFSTLLLHEISGPVVIEDSHSKIKLGLLETAGGYNFDLDLEHGTLTGSIPPFLEVVKEDNETWAQGRLGPGDTEIRLRTKFGDLKLDLIE